MDQQVNLYQPIMGAEKRLFSTRALVLCLATLLGFLMALITFESRRTTRIERAVSQLEQREASNIEMAARGNAILRPTLSIAQLDAEAKQLSVNIAARERALDIMRRGAVSVANGFAARMEALASRRLDGIWLTDIVLGSGESRLAMQGRATDRNLLPVFLDGLTHEAAMDGVRFDSLSMRRALAAEAPAQVVFAMGAPGLKFTPLEHSP